MNPTPHPFARGQRRPLAALLVVTAVAALAGCSADRSDIALTARIGTPTATIRSSSVGADASGSFALVISLGAYASGNTEVSPGTFSLERNGTELLAPLSLAGADFPVRLDVGKKVTLPITFTASTDPSVADTICAPGEDIQMRGTLTDSLSKGRTTLVESVSFAPTCE